MLSLLNFRNYELEYAIEYPEAIKRYKMTSRTPFNTFIQGFIRGS